MVVATCDYLLFYIISQMYLIYGTNTFHFSIVDFPI